MKESKHTVFEKIDTDVDGISLAGTNAHASTHAKQSRNTPEWTAAHGGPTLEHGQGMESIPLQCQTLQPEPKGQVLEI